MTITILTMQTPTATPAIDPQIVQQAERVLDVWNTLGPLMAVLFVAALALFAVILIFFGSRNSNSTAISLLAQISTQKDADLKEAREDRKKEHEQHIESLSAIHDQIVRSNDVSVTTNAILNIMNQQGIERHAMQEQMAKEVAEVLADGSRPVRQIKDRVEEIIQIAGRLDTRTADWNAILAIIQPLLVELGALRVEAKKHSTQPIPSIPPVPPESAGITIEGTIQGTIVEGGTP